MKGGNNTKEKNTVGREKIESQNDDENTKFIKVNNIPFVVYV